MKGECGICEYWAGDAMIDPGGECRRTEIQPLPQSCDKWCGKFRPSVDRVLEAALGPKTGKTVKLDWDENGVQYER